MARQIMLLLNSSTPARKRERWKAIGLSKAYLEHLRKPLNMIPTVHMAGSACEELMLFPPFWLVIIQQRK